MTDLRFALANSRPLTINIQQQTADALGLTQVKVSREEKKIFTQLREALA
jgi:DNA-directed RNA polymerase specialized sigma subunit